MASLEIKAKEVLFFILFVNIYKVLKLLKKPF